MRSPKMRSQKASNTFLTNPRRHTGMTYSRANSLCAIVAAHPDLDMWLYYLYVCELHLLLIDVYIHVNHCTTVGSIKVYPHLVQKETLILPTVVQL